MPRSNRRRRDEVELDLGRALGGVERREVHTDGTWFVRAVSGAGGASRAGRADGAKAYRCPGCDQEVAPSVAHVVAWPADGPWSDAAALAGRRHWHTACWRARGRRRPTR